MFVPQIVMNMLLGPSLFRAAIVAVGEACLENSDNDEESAVTVIASEPYRPVHR